MALSLNDYFEYSIMVFMIWGVAQWVVWPSAMKKFRGSGSPSDMEAPYAQAAAESAPIAPNSSSPRLYFLDNIKIFLTVSVVCHHILCAFNPLPITGTMFMIHTEPFGVSFFGLVVARPILTIDQVYFMALFFFISGYFTPSSLQRRGMVEFLKDKYKRYGIPALLYLFVWCPFQTWIICMICGTPFDYWTGLLDPRQAWYIIWLLIFSVLYAMARPDPIVVRAPQVIELLLLGLLLGIWYMLVPTEEMFAFIPAGGIHSGVTYIVAFTGGILAKQGDWLNQLEDGLNEARYFLRCLCVFLLVAIYVVFVEAWYFPDSANQFRPYWWVCCGLFAVVFSMVVMQVARAHFNCIGPVSRFMAESMYTVYLIHFLFIDMAICSFYWLLSIMGPGIMTPWPPGNRTLLYVSEASNELWLWAGFIYTVIVANLLVWPAAYAIKQIPGLNQIL